MDSRDLRPCPGSDVNHLVNQLTGTKPIGVRTKVITVKNVFLVSNAGEIDRWWEGPMRLGQMPPESPQFKGLCFRRSFWPCCFQTDSWRLFSAYQSAQRKFQQPGSGGARSCLLPCMGKGRLDVSSLIAQAPIRRNNRVSGQADSCPLQKGSFQV